jgi:hypothetical protein
MPAHCTLALEIYAASIAHARHMEMLQNEMLQNIQALEATAAKPSTPSKPSKLRVAGFREDRTGSREENEDVEYESIPARCNATTPLGMASDFELYGDADGTNLPEEVMPHKLGQAVLIRGLPRQLCTKQMIQVMLEQARLKGRVLDCMLKQGSSSGEVLIWLPNLELANYAVWHFNGCTWTKDRRGNEVHALLVETAVKPEMNSKLAEEAAEKLLAVLQEPQEDWPKDAQGNAVRPPWLPALAESKREARGEGDASKSLSTIWEANELNQTETAAEVSTDAGASGTSVTSEAEDNHESEEGADDVLRTCSEVEVSAGEERSSAGC